MQWPWQDLGSLPDWVEALGTSGALIYIAVQYHRDRGKDREAREQALQDARAATKERQDREAIQARQITCSHGWSFSSHDGYAVSVNVVNDSDQVIRHLALVVREAETGEDGLDTERPVVLPTKLTAQRLGAGEPVTLTGVPQFQPGPRRHGDDDDGTKALDMVYRVGVSFTDAAGLRWNQFPNGIPLRRIESTLDVGWRVEPSK